MNLAAATPKPKHEKTMSRRSTVKLSFSSPWHPIEFVAGVESDRPPTRTVTIVSSAARTSASGNQLLHVAIACYAARRPSTSGNQRPCQLLHRLSLHRCRGSNRGDESVNAVCMHLTTAASLEPWYEAAHPLNCLSSVIYKFIDWSCCARRCPLVASGPRSWRIVNTCRPSRGTTRWKLSPLLLLIVWGEHAVICAYSFVVSHGENLRVSLHDLFSATPSLAFVPIRIFSKWLHRCLVVRAKQAAMQITYGTCPRNSLIYDQPQCVSTSLVKSRVLLC